MKSVSLLAGPRQAVQYVKSHKADMFWLWIGYQTVKGTATLSLIWLPLFLAWKTKL
ncbi:hypothetical protein ACFFUB_13620 [Algimonas porphyrae]|uniref:Uncharacterized protein n=1 Tax=Algimonas porphyrae TaxID=1128113 RepID=A0ABQ5UW05_9PROT|nr:hypothetical protein [Algimonas porphyrae]GLQ19459.1 hypothetical protein GCM10007854_04140 [Algimonas porphyrae]